MGSQPELALILLVLALHYAISLQSQPLQFLKRLRAAISDVYMSSLESSLVDKPCLYDWGTPDNWANVKVTSFPY